MRRPRPRRPARQPWQAPVAWRPGVLVAARRWRPGRLARRSLRRRLPGLARRWRAAGVSWRRPVRVLVGRLRIRSAPWWPWPVGRCPLLAAAGRCPRLVRQARRLRVPRPWGALAEWWPGALVVAWLRACRLARRSLGRWLRVLAHEWRVPAVRRRSPPLPPGCWPGVRPEPWQGWPVGRCPPLAAAARCRCLVRQARRVRRPLGALAEWCPGVPVAAPLLPMSRTGRPSARAARLTPPPPGQQEPGRCRRLRPVAGPARR